MPCCRRTERPRCSARTPLWVAPVAALQWWPFWTALCPAAHSSSAPYQRNIIVRAVPRILRAVPHQGSSGQQLTWPRRGSSCRNIVETVKKLLLTTGVIAIIQPGSNMQGALGALLSFAYCIIYAANKPWLKATTNKITLYFQGARPRRAAHQA